MTTRITIRRYIKHVLFQFRVINSKLIYSNNLQSWLRYIQLCIRITLIYIDILCITRFIGYARINICLVKLQSSSRISGLRASSVVTSSTPGRFIDADRQLSRNRSTRCSVMSRILRAKMPGASIDRLEYRLISPDIIKVSREPHLTRRVT